MQDRKTGKHYFEWQIDKLGLMVRNVSPCGRYADIRKPTQKELDARLGLAMHGQNRAVVRATKKFNSIDALNKAQDAGVAGVAKQKAKHNDSWDKPRQSVTGYWNPEGKRLAGSSIKGGKL